MISFRTSGRIGAATIASRLACAVAAAAPAHAQTLTSVPLSPSTTSQAARFVRLPADHTSVTFENSFDWENERKHLYTHGYAGGGVCVGDYDNDGLPDIYLVSQTGRDGLFRQVGNMRFEDATASSMLTGGDDWGTGASFADIDDDGDLDLYVCNLDAPNLLYVNNGDGTFTEAAHNRGVDFSGASVMAAFADYDLDGDVDLYLVTNRLYPRPVDDVPRTAHDASGKVIINPDDQELFALQERVINGQIQKFVIKAGQRDRLYRNNGDGTFVDVSAAAGIVGITGNHPGLSATWWDADGDNDPDLYVCNDFWDADRFYRNNGDGTFTDILEQAVPHTPWFSMGADFGDINNDGRLDFLAADMSATTHVMSKLMMGDMNESRWFLESAQPRQYMRNALYLNSGTPRFMEAAFLAGLASTDWTWSVKFGDLDNDGRLDAFFTNGTANHSFDPDLTIKQRQLEVRLNRSRVRDRQTRWDEQWKLYRSVPPRPEANLAFRNTGNLRFENVAQRWGLDHLGISFGAALSDLDRDGDLDLIVNNVDEPVSVYRNDASRGNGVLLRLVGRQSNRFGLGATVTIETSVGVQTRYLMLTRGYMSANEPIVHFGLGESATIDRMIIAWPSGQLQRFENLRAGRFYTITEPAEEAIVSSGADKLIPAFEEVAQSIGLRTGSAPERVFDDFARQPLLPARLSQLGPGLALGDVDGDGDDDAFLGGSSGRPATLYLNNEGSFTKQSPGPWQADAAHEDLACLFFDADADGDLDLYVASGSVECAANDPVLRDRLYINDGSGQFTGAAPGVVPDVADSTGVVVAGDYDQDGDLDLFVGARVIPGAYPMTPVSRLLRNDGGVFVEATAEVAPGLEQVGLVTGALWSDANDDGRLDLLITTEWGPISYWSNSGSGLVNETAAANLADRAGWYNGITGADLDHDGDIDYIVTNAGLNNKYNKTSPEKPALLYYGDFDNSGRRRLVEAKAGENSLLPVRGRSCSSAAMPFIYSRLPTYRSFAMSSLQEIYTQQCLDDAVVLKATHLESVVLFNETTLHGHATFRIVALPRLAQIAPGHGVAATDYDGDGDTDVYLVQNFNWREPETGHWDGGLSLLLRNDGQGNLEPVWSDESGLVVAGDATAIAVADLDADARPDFIVTRNNARTLAFRQSSSPATSRSTSHLAIRLAGPNGNPTGVGARVTVRTVSGAPQTAEVYAGSGYLSQSSPWLFFGRGDLGQPVQVHVRWPDGNETEHRIEAEQTRAILSP